MDADQLLGKPVGSNLHCISHSRGEENSWLCNDTRCPVTVRSRTNTVNTSFIFRTFLWHLALTRRAAWRAFKIEGASETSSLRERKTRKTQGRGGKRKSKEKGETTRVRKRGNKKPEEEGEIRSPREKKQQDARGRGGNEK